VLCFPSRLLLACDVCGRTVSLYDCNTDENGDAVHEECYLRKLRLDTSSPVNQNASFSVRIYGEST
jgi:hypothetical protein